MKYILILIGGGIGSLLRYAFLSPMTKSALSFPWGTLAVNLSGSFAIGFLWGLSQRLAFPSHWKAFLFVGVLGGFTTFSAYSLENFNLLRSGENVSAIFNIVLSNILGIGLVFLGFGVSRYFF